MPVSSATQAHHDVYPALAELSNRYRQVGGETETGLLTPFELGCFSQHGEDGVIAEILCRIGIGARFFVEFGIESGREGNCVFLADVLGWGGVFIESDEAMSAALLRKYAANRLVTGQRGTVTPENVESLFKESSVPAQPDVLSIDADGPDYWIWRAIEAYRPSLVVIEYNPSLPPDRKLVQPREHEHESDGTDYFGASLDALAGLGAEKGYALVHTDLAAANAFFVREDLAEGRFPTGPDVPRRMEPNDLLSGYRHSRDTTGRTYLDPDTAQQLAASRSAASVVPKAENPAPRAVEASDASDLATRTDFLWHQRFELADGVYSPGVNDVGFLIESAGLPERLDGESVLDIGTTNGGVAFELERRGAGRILAIDIMDADAFGFNAIKRLLGSSVEHLQASVYELPKLLDDQFDIVLFFGVLYHLRHPILALDNVRALTRTVACIESAICDAELAGHPDGPAVARFYRRDELAADPTNWFAPNLVALAEWCASCGLEPERTSSWPKGAPSRGMIVAHPSSDVPEYQRISYEQPLNVSVR
jgi:SAM-dependent methyltransferase